MNNTGESKIDNLLDRIKSETMSPPQIPGSGARQRPSMIFDTSQGTQMKRPQNLNFSTPPSNMQLDKNDKKLQEIMKNSGKLKISGFTYNTELKDMEHIEELGNGTCGHVVKMRHKPSDKTIAVKQMRRTGNNEENKRIVMDIEVVIKSHDCPYIVQCLGCFITDAEVWICMELMATCFDKLLKRVKQPIPEYVLGKVTVATVKALAYLKDKHGIIHRDVKPSNILLDERGNVKLCDFGISGRLVDSMAATRSVGCTAYLAPERITIDHNNKQDYDVRADVWSLGITLVELATGVFPYKDCSTEFEVLTKVVEQDPPSLPSDKDFSIEFRKFVNCCLIKDQKQRPKYVKLQKEAFIAKHEMSDVNVGEWFVNAVRQVEGGASPPTINPLSPRQKHASFVFRHHQRQLSEPPPQTSPPILVTNGTTQVDSPKISDLHVTPHLPPDGRGHISRISTFQMQRDSYATDKHVKSEPRTFSPFQAYQNHIITKSNTEHVMKQRHYSPLPQRHITVDTQSPLLQRRGDCSVTSPYMQRKDRWNSPVGSPLPLRNHIQPDEQPYNCGNTSPIVLQRFYHQQKQQQQAKEAEEQQTTTSKPDNISGRKRIASYIKLQLNSSDRSGRSSRHQSPEPPPRLNRGVGDSQSPLAVRRHFFENTAPASPSLSRRYISPAPPMPPPRHLSESISVPGSPQHVRARFHYTPEPQRRLFQNSDVS